MPTDQLCGASSEYSGCTVPWRRVGLREDRVRPKALWETACFAPERHGRSSWSVPCLSGDQLGRINRCGLEHGLGSREVSGVTDDHAGQERSQGT